MDRCSQAQAGEPMSASAKDAGTASSCIEAFQVHAFSPDVFGGNPAGVCLLDTWPDDAQLRRIAQEFGPSVTAFVLKTADDERVARSFTRGGREVDSLCGHAMFSTAHVLLNLKEPGRDGLDLLTPEGPMHIGRAGEKLTMRIPHWNCVAVDCPEAVVHALGVLPAESHMGPRDLMVVFEDEGELGALAPDFDALKVLGDTGLIAAAKRSDHEVAFRFFCPGFSIAENEDHATGSALSSLAPFWSARLQKTRFSAIQISERGGAFDCHVDDGTVTIASTCATFLAGVISTPDSIQEDLCE